MNFRARVRNIQAKFETVLWCKSAWTHCLYQVFLVDHKLFLTKYNCYLHAVRVLLSYIYVRMSKQFPGRPHWQLLTLLPQTVAKFQRKWSWCFLIWLYCKNDMIIYLEHSGRQQIHSTVLYWFPGLSVGCRGCHLKILCHMLIISIQWMMWQLPQGLSDQ